MDRTEGIVAGARCPQSEVHGYNWRKNGGNPSTQGRARNPETLLDGTGQITSLSLALSARPGERRAASSYRLSFGCSMRRMPILSRDQDESEASVLP